jgi:V/A-type H+-transporting ATPase subunit D
MAKKVKLTRPELKRQRDMMTRFQRYLPMLKLKQQQLQMTIRSIEKQRRDAQKAYQDALRKFEGYREVLNDLAGLNIRDLAKPRETKVSRENIAGVDIPVFDDVVFDKADYSLFGTPAWVDAALRDLRDVSRNQAKLDVLEERSRLLQRELTKIVQRVNLFEKVKIPESREIIRVIRIKLGDEMTAAVGRGKIAKSKISSEGPQEGAEPHWAEPDSEAEQQEVPA